MNSPNNIEANPNINVSVPQDEKPLPVYLYYEMKKKGDGFERTGKILVDYKKYSEWLKTHFAIHNFNKRIYIFKPELGIYRENANEIETYIRGTYITYGVSGFLSNIIRETLTHIRAMGNDVDYPFIGTYGTINLKNGILTLKTGILMPASPTNLCDYRVKTEYKTFENTDELYAFLDTYGNREPIAILAKGIYQRAMHDTLKEITICVGPKDSGKTTCCELVQATLDGDTSSNSNTSRTLLAPLLARFGYADLEGKIMNYGDDLPDQFVKNTAKINTLVGSISQQVEKKGRDGYTTNITAIQVFSCNHLPPLDDDDSVIWDKIRLVEFKNVIVNKKPRDELFTETIKQQLLYRACELAKKWITETPYRNTQTGDEIRAMWHEAITCVEEFLLSAVVVSYEAENTIEAIKEHYAKWCVINHKKPYYKQLTKQIQFARKHTQFGNVYSYRLVKLPENTGKPQPIPYSPEDYPHDNVIRVDNKTDGMAKSDEEKTRIATQRAEQIATGKLPKEISEKFSPPVG